MACSDLSAAKALLLAVQLASQADISRLRSLVLQHPIRTDILLRVLLTHLPETVDVAEYVPFLEELAFGHITAEGGLLVDSSGLDELSESVARLKARKLHLLPLAWPNHPSDIPSNPFELFLIHRSLRIDEHTGLIDQLPEMLTPFLHLSPYLRTWTITTILPLTRFNNEYYPEESNTITLSKFEKMNDAEGLALLLSRTGRHEDLVGRDLRCLVGPWMYGDTRLKRRKLFSKHNHDHLAGPLDSCTGTDLKYAGWEETFKWVTDHATTSWKVAVAAIEQWDGPGDIDCGKYEDGTMLLDEDEQQHFEMRYARSILATGYLISEESIDALDGINRVLIRLIALMDNDRIPALQQAAALLSPVADFEQVSLLASKNATFLRSNLLDEKNTLTTPNEAPIQLLHTLLVSAYLCTKIGCKITVRRAGELTLLQDENEQKYEFNRLMHHINISPKGDDKYWIRIRNEILWLRSWGAEDLAEIVNAKTGRGIFGTLPKEFIEAQILKSLLTNTRYSLARSLYETSPERPLPSSLLQETIISAAMLAYDNATNPSRMRGGVKKCDEIIHTFPDALADSLSRDQTDHLIKVTHAVSQYRLVFKQGEPFKPVTLRVHNDPISIIGKILDQNPGSYSNINDFVDMGKSMVQAGLTNQSFGGEYTTNQVEFKTGFSVAEKRVVSMCIDAALAEDDFETAYSFVVTRLKEVGRPAHARSPSAELRGQGLQAELPSAVIDDWSWRAALQAGKYRQTAQTIKPTHLGNTSGNLEIRHLEQRMECLAQALRLAPKAILQEILNVYRRCEEELESLAKQEEEQEDAWDAQGDLQAMPGVFKSSPMKKNEAGRSTARGEEAPMSLFDLSRASVARAQSGFSSLSMLRGSNVPQQASVPRGSNESSRADTPEMGASKSIRKRDQLKNAAVGGLASGIGWLINAPPQNNDHGEHIESR